MKHPVVDKTSLLRFFWNMKGRSHRYLRKRTAFLSGLQEIKNPDHRDQNTRRLNRVG